LLGVNGFDWTDDEVAYVRFYPNGTSDEMRMILTGLQPANDVTCTWK
jgi:hypothetical protein